MLSLYSAIAYWMMLGREAVLRMNGSNIRGWWFAHHILGMMLSAAMITWNKQKFIYVPVRRLLFIFYLYLGLVQLLQYRYQMNRLYVLRALSRIDPMETTNELAQNNIHYKLLFLLPFLVGAYGMQFYLAACVWMARPRTVSSVAVALLYLVLGSGNMITTCYTYYRKLIHVRDRGRREERCHGREGERCSQLIRRFSRSTENLHADTECSEKNKST